MFKKVLIIISLSLSFHSFSLFFDESDLDRTLDNLTLVCGYNYKERGMDWKKLVIYIKDGVLIDYNGNVEFKKQRNGIGLFEGKVAGFIGELQFVIRNNFKTLRDTDSGSSMVIDTDLTGCSLSIDDYHKGNFIKTLGAKN